MKEYSIAGKHKSDGKFYLICICGGNKEHAEKVLIKQRNDKELTKDYSDFVIQEHESKDCWWNEGTNWSKLGQPYIQYQ